MPEKNDFNEYLPEQKPEEYSIDIPAEPVPIQPGRIPSGDDPMGRIEQRGIVYSNLARGRTPWWILMAGWVVFGGLTLGLLKMAIAGSIVSWVLLVISLLPLVILAQGTLVKIKAR